MQNYEQRFKQSCDDLHIQVFQFLYLLIIQKGKDIREELHELTKELPSLFHNIVQLAREKTITSAIEYYKAFTIYNLQVSSPNANDKDLSLLSSLSHIINNGDAPILSSQSTTVIDSSSISSNKSDAPKFVHVVIYLLII